MFIHYRTEGFIFKKEDRGESNQLFIIFSKDFGKLEILAKAIRKISSKLRSGMEIFYLSDIEFIQGKNYKTLTDAILIEKFENLRKDLRRLNIGYKIAEVLDNFVRGQEAEEKILQLILEVFQKLNNLQFKIYNLQLIYHYFFWNLVSILGYKPELYNCSICQKILKPENIYFSEKEGGVICQECLLKTKKALAVPSEIIKILRLILEKDWQILSKLKVENDHLKYLDIISKKYSSFIYENKNF